MRLTLILALMAALAAAQKSDRGEVQLAGATKKEVVDGDLKGAIDQYKKIIAANRANHALAAKALVQMGQCYEKLGDAEARKAYDQVLKDYPDQKELAETARARLAKLGGGGQAGQKATRAVWTGPKVDGGESSVSPDGRFISFPDWDTGNLTLHDLATGADRILTKNGNLQSAGEAFAEVSAISRDGKQVAYAWYDGKLDRYELRVLSLNGDPTPRRVFENASVDYIEPDDWSPDGKWIAVALTSKQTCQIGLIGAQDGSVRVLKSGISRTDNPSAGGFSSDGKYIVYTHKAAGVIRGYILSVDGNSEVPLVSGAASSESPVWTPDGSQIVFVSDLSGSPGLWSVRVADGKPLGEPELLKADFGDAHPMSFARDGSFLYEVSTNPTDIYIANLDPITGRLTSEPKRVNQRVGNSWGRVAWLPDGKSLSFWNRSTPGTLVEHNLSTGEEREVWGGKSGRVPSGYSGWFPDGHTIMGGQINGQTKGQTLTFRRVDSSTGEVKASWTVPALPPGAAQPIYSPDLMTMFFARKDENVPCKGAKCTYSMIARDVETGRDRELFRIEAMYPRNASISLDGRDMAFIIGTETGNERARLIMVAPTAGGAPREIYRSTDNGSVSGTAWTRDGGHVLALRRFPAGGEIWSLPTKGGSPEKSPLRIHPSETPAVSPDGTQIAFVGGQGNSEIWAMTGLFPSAKPAAGR